MGIYKYTSFFSNARSLSSSTFFKPDFQNVFFQSSLSFSSSWDNIRIHPLLTKHKHLPLPHQHQFNPLLWLHKWKLPIIQIPFCPLNPSPKRSSPRPLRRRNNQQRRNSQLRRRKRCLQTVLRRWKSRRGMASKDYVGEL